MIALVVAAIAGGRPHRLFDRDIEERSFLSEFSRRSRFSPEPRFTAGAP